MPQDAYTLRHIAAELCRTLGGGTVNRIDQQGRDEVSIVFYRGKTYRLVLSANATYCGAYFDEARAENPLVAPNFCMLLRKHLQGAKLRGVSLVGFERILCFRFDAGSDFSEGEKELYLEVMGKYSNLILVQDGIVLGALKTTTLDGPRRIVFSGAPYVLPAPQDKADPFDPIALAAALKNTEGDRANALFTRVRGIAPVTAEAIVKSYTGGDFATHVRNFILSDDVFPCIVRKNGKASDFCAYPVESAEQRASLLEAVSLCYGERRAAAHFDARRRTLVSAVRAAAKKKEKRLAQILEQQALCKDRELLRMQGELLTANLYRIRQGAEGVELVNYSDENGGTLRIRLDPRLSPSQNAQNYFKRYRKQKRTVEALAPQETEVRAELDYLNSLLALAACAETEEDLSSLEEECALAQLIKEKEKKKTNKKPEIPYRVFEYKGFRIYAGRNNLQNDRLLRAAAPDDLWLHTQRYHSCHTVIRAEGKEVPAEVKEYAAAVCAKYSEAHERVPVDCCPVKFVKKPPKAKAGFVTYTNFETLSGDPAKL